MSSPARALSHGCIVSEEARQQVLLRILEDVVRLIAGVGTPAVNANVRGCATGSQVIPRWSLPDTCAIRDGSTL